MYEQYFQGYFVHIYSLYLLYVCMTRWILLLQRIGAKEEEEKEKKKEEEKEEEEEEEKEEEEEEVS